MLRVLCIRQNAYGKNLRKSLYKAWRIDIKQKEKYSEYSSEQAVEAINRRSELYREYIKKGENNFSVLHNEN